ncbi:glycosyltransferase family 4 protein [Methanocalculus natronophilus]|uniref:glycosyltransferase family 4 protein n=1 Tax=Methanocalculus natronophilus TaxID=1262400 RepID=UPI0031B63030
MKILIINSHPSDALGGSEMQCDLIARGLTERGNEVIYGAVGRKRKESYTGLPYRVVSLAIERRGALTKVLQEENPDVIYWRFNKHYLLQAVKESKRAGVSFVFAVSHVNDVTKYAYKPIMVRSRMDKALSYFLILVQMIHSGWNYRAFQYVTAVTTLNSQYLGRLPVKKQRVVWNSVPLSEDPFNWEKKYCVWIANIKPSKRPEAYIKLASILKERCPELDFLMIGAIQNKFYNSIIQEAEEHNNFYYLGFQSPEFVNGVLAKAECMLHTCEPEGFGNNFIQAWIQGCPTITLEFDPDGLIQTEHLGFVSGTIEQMANDVETLLKDEKLGDEIGNRAQAFAHANFTPDRMVDEIEAFLEEVVHEYRRS